MYFAILAPAFLVVLGLIVDGGAKVRALQRADNIASEAARTAGQAINAGQAMTGGTKEVDPALAADAAQAYLGDLNGVTGSVTVAPDLQNLTVTVSLSWDPLLLDLFGALGSTTVSGAATVTLVAQ
ncbi:TadE/TadG family type IV pilus assembly protein [Micromonospora gifhornensis]|uniref:TadE/TadG family type IV pilus assembly protein n=1 Tax=Micromonospora gifhornensis TaxID=84594 RepID=UPI003666224B